MDEKTAKIVAIVLFAVTYICLLIFSKRRAIIAVVAALLYVILGIMPLDKLPSAINWNLILMLFGIMGTVTLFIESKMPALIGDIIIRKAPNVKWAIVILAMFAGLVSAFIDNVATVLIAAPIAIGICKKLNISPVPSIIAIAISSNLQGAATLVGDTTSILLGNEAGMSFFDFFVFNGKMSLFFIVQISALATAIFFLFVFRKNKEKMVLEEKTQVSSYYPSILLLSNIALLIAASFIPQKWQFELTNGIICIGIYLIGLVIFAAKKRSRKEVWSTVKEIDVFTLLLLMGLFVVVSSIGHVGLIDDLAGFFVGISDNKLVIYLIIVVASVILSAFIDNIPYVAAMLPVTAGISALLGIEPYLLYFGLLCAATLGGNLTPIGASANITAMGILRKEGHKVSVGRFMKLSVPFTLIAATIGCGLVWFIWA